MKQVKIIRILEYVGDEEWMKRQMERNGVQGFLSLGETRWIREVYCSPPQDISKSIATPDLKAS